MTSPPAPAPAVSLDRGLNGLHQPASRRAIRPGPAGLTGSYFVVFHSIDVHLHDPGVYGTDGVIAGQTLPSRNGT